MTALSALAPAHDIERPRVRYRTMDTETLLARFGLSPHLVCRWTEDEEGRLACAWDEKMVPHRPLVARLARKELRDG